MNREVTPDLLLHLLVPLNNRFIAIKLICQFKYSYQWMLQKHGAIIDRCTSSAEVFGGLMVEKFITRAITLVLSLDLLVR